MKKLLAYGIAASLVMLGAHAASAQQFKFGHSVNLDAGDVKVGEGTGVAVGIDNKGNVNASVDGAAAAKVGSNTFKDKVSASASVPAAVILEVLGQ